MGIFSGRKKIVDGWHWTRQPGTNGKDDPGEGYPIKVEASKKNSKATKWGFALFVCIVIAFFIMAYTNE